MSAIVSKTPELREQLLRDQQYLETLANLIEHQKVRKVSNSGPEEAVAESFIG